MGIKQWVFNERVNFGDLNEAFDTVYRPIANGTGLNGIQRTLNDRFSERISVKDFGAWGNGQYDDTVAIQAAVNASPYVYFPPGTYNVSQAISTPSLINIVLQGAGSGVSVINGGGFTGTILKVNTIIAKVDGLQITRSNTAGIGLDVSGVTQLAQLSDVATTLHNTTGIYFGSANSQIFNCPGYSNSGQSITSLNVTTALGYTPYNQSNPSGYITGTTITAAQINTALTYTPANKAGGTITGNLTISGVLSANSIVGVVGSSSITGAQVNSALGYTPYNQSNPSNYQNTTGTVAYALSAGTSGSLSASLIITALSYTPYNQSNPSNYISSITSANVNSALGYTPYNQSNPSGYITGTTITAAQINTALTYTPYNQSNPSGYITGITSLNVVTALSYTPYNQSNPSAYISSITGAQVNTALGYTPVNIAGSTMTGTLVHNTGINFGSNAAGSNTDLTKHIALYSTTYGFGVTSNRLNYVANSTAGHIFIIGSSDCATISSSGIWSTGAIVAAGATFTGSVTVAGTLSATAYSGISSANIPATSALLGGSGTAGSAIAIAVGTNLSITSGTLNASGSGLGPGTITGALTITTTLGVGGNTKLQSLGVGTSADGTTGDIVATGNITAYYSDQRLKKNITPIQNALDKVCQISGITYNNNALAHSFGYFDKKQQVGVLAQEIEQVLPEAVTLAPFDRYHDGTSISGKDYKTVHYHLLTPLLIEAIKELKARIEVLEKK